MSAPNFWPVYWRMAMSAICLLFFLYKSVTLMFGFNFAPTGEVSALAGGMGAGMALIFLRSAEQEIAKIRDGLRARLSGTL